MRGSPERARTSSLLVSSGREAAFLDLDFDSSDRPLLVTQVLSLAEEHTDARARDEQPNDSPLWGLSVASRLKRLLHVLRDTEGISALPLRVHCPATNCRQTLELELALAELDSLHDEAADGELLRFPRGEAEPLAFRRPTGDDLRRWRSANLTTSTAPETLFRTLLVSPSAEPEPLEPRSVDACLEAFAEFDALVAFEVSTTCPHCAHTSPHPVDLESLALNHLRSAQERLYREIHFLAQAYGWSETEILAVPRRRRLRYLAHLGVSS